MYFSIFNNIGKKQGPAGSVDHLYGSADPFPYKNVTVLSLLETLMGILNHHFFNKRHC
jgi:hypothetical protein